MKKLEVILKVKTPTSTIPTVTIEDDNELQADRLYNTINFKERYLEGDLNRPVIPVIVFACNRVSVSKVLISVASFCVIYN